LAGPTFSSIQRVNKNALISSPGSTTPRVESKVFSSTVIIPPSKLFNDEILGIRTGGEVQEMKFIDPTNLTNTIETSPALGYTILGFEVIS
jgi:hypothetical protein